MGDFWTFCLICSQVSTCSPADLKHKMYKMHSNITNVHNTSIIHSGILPLSELIFSFVCYCSQQKQVSFDRACLPSKLWTMSPPAPLRIKDTHMFDHHTSSFSGVCRLKTNTGLLSFEMPFVRSCERNPFSPPPAQGLQPVPRRTSSIHQQCSWTKPPT